MELIRDCLDKQVVDPHGRPLGRVDGIVMEIIGDKQPEVAYVEIGALTRLNRFSKRLAGYYASIALRMGVTELQSHRIPWQQAVSTAIEVVVNEEADNNPALAFEFWLRDKIVAKIPGN